VETVSNNFKLFIVIYTFHFYNFHIKLWKWTFKHTSFSFDERNASKNAKCLQIQDLHV